jgi:tRNA(Ile2) C34 agmatinyltransferase TiaS
MIPMPDLDDVYVELNTDCPCCGKKFTAKGNTTVYIDPEWVNRR